ncbi:MAG TPA: type II toxin-antitoxin system RelE/ParE family toxin [Bryobacteraceae bacterium]|nr:type II toxin-antitoxin system RelE/ParE family toxin [Bryobacteraceae bacterium]
MAWSWQEHPATAGRFANSLLSHVDILKDFPFVGAPVKRLPTVRRLLHSPLHVYYRVNEKERRIEVLHFWHYSRRAPHL